MLTLHSIIRTNTNSHSFHTTLLQGLKRKTRVRLSCVLRVVRLTLPSPWSSVCLCTVSNVVCRCHLLLSSLDCACFYFAALEPTGSDFGLSMSLTTSHKSQVTHTHTHAQAPSCNPTLFYVSSTPPQNSSPFDNAHYTYSISCLLSMHDVQPPPQKHQLPLSMTYASLLPLLHQF